LHKELKQFEEAEDSNLDNLVLRLRFLGVIPKVEYTEYGFRIEDKDKNVRRVVLTIQNVLFRQKDLKFQEAPDLCYQKVLADLESETSDSPIPARMRVTEEDIVHYRDLHRNMKARKRS
jgi:hypothetical protein